MTGIHMQPTPNPMAFKFIVDQPLKLNGKATFRSVDEAKSLPLVENTFMIRGVTDVHLFQNTMTVTHAGELSEQELASQVEAVLLTRMPLHRADFEGPSDQKKSTDRTQLSPERRQIEEILDRTIRPGLQADGGDIEVLSFEHNEVRVLYQGACGGCPSSLMGTLDAIQSILQHEMDNPSIVVSPV